MTEPCVPNYILGLAMCGVIVGVFGAVAVAYAWSVMRRAALGDALLNACAEDWDTAAIAVDNVRRENEAMDMAFRRGAVSIPPEDTQ